MMESSDVVMASSTSGIVPSLLSDHLRHRHRFLVAHPVRMLVSAGLHAIIKMKHRLVIFTYSVHITRKSCIL